MNLLTGAALRRHLAGAALLATAAAAVAPQAALAQNFPSRAVTIVAPFAAGGPVDALSRLIGRNLADRWQQPVIVDNRAGGGTIIGTQFAARAPADGYTILMTSLAYTTNQVLVKNLPYAADALEPLAMVATAPNILYVGSGVPANNVKEFVALAKAKPGTMTFASSGNGSSLHMAAELFASETGVSFIHVPYKGAGPALVDMLGGQVSAIFDTTVQSMEHARAGKFKALGVASKNRFSLSPNVPTFAEQGYPNIQSSTWVGFLAPKGMPPAVRARLFDDIQSALKSRDIQDGIQGLGFQPTLMTQPEFAAHLDTERKRWGEVITKRHITLD